MKVTKDTMDALEKGATPKPSELERKKEPTLQETIASGCL